MLGSPAVVSPQHESLAEASQQDAAAAVSQQADPAAGSAADVAAEGPAAAAGVVAEGRRPHRGTLWVPSSAWPAGAPVGTPWPSPVVQLPADRVVSLGASASTVWTSQGAPSGSWTHGLPRRSVAPDGAPKLARAPHTHRACRIVATPFVVEMETAAGAAPAEEDT